MSHLREMPESEIDPSTLAYIRQTAKQAACNFTVVEGTVTRHIYILMHKADKPSAELITKYENQEFAALEPVGAKQ